MIFTFTYFVGFVVTAFLIEAFLDDWNGNILPCLLTAILWPLVLVTFFGLMWMSFSWDVAERIKDERRN